MTKRGTKHEAGTEGRRGDPSGEVIRRRGNPNGVLLTATAIFRVFDGAKRSRRR